MTFNCCTLEGLDAERGSFDAVVFVASLHHMAMEDAICKERDLLAEEGVLLVVGLASPSSLPDYVVDVFRLVPSRISTCVHGMRTTEDLDVSTSYDVPSMAVVRDVMHHLLPGATVRHGLYWRYLLRWQKDS